ncbi:MAG: allantoicase [Gammaproteobacteria bacterium]|nr:allantoicase [Gammaproteobacteria bacterium]
MSKDSIQNLSEQWINLAQPRLGAEVISTTDDFFALKERLIKPDPPIFIPDKFDDHGKWMDGWESRRKRTPGHDHCIVRLGHPGSIKAIDIDTTHFIGNHPPHASLDACCSDADPSADTQWVELVARAVIEADTHNRFEVEDSRPWSHVRLNIYPDGGVARLRVYGEVYCDWNRYDKSDLLDLAAMEHGGRALTCNDMHFGSIENLIAPGRGINMGDGWETRRRREPGHDWAILALGHVGIVKRIEVDTANFKGNYPDRCSVQAARVTTGDLDTIVGQSTSWDTLLPEQKLQMDRQHFFETEIQDIGAITHVRFNIFPDGGVSRIRVFGHLG